MTNDPIYEHNSQKYPKAIKFPKVLTFVALFQSWLFITT
jgi:hypothetical protein